MSTIYAYRASLRARSANDIMTARLTRVSRKTLYFHRSVRNNLSFKSLAPRWYGKKMTEWTRIMAWRKTGPGDASPF